MKTRQAFLLPQSQQLVVRFASDGEASASLKNVLGLDLDDVDVERIESTLEALREVFGESEANVRTVGRSHEAEVPSYRLAEQSEILYMFSSQRFYHQQYADFLRVEAEKHWLFFYCKNL
ncbi:MAG: hypothetical protein E7452_06140 [Ruminococcaceae bacterium]|nr:hypothetical protein [Oscillospiraceae bacterium]